MALTLIEMSKVALGRDEVIKSSIMEYFASGSELLSVLPFETIVGNAISFNRELTLPNVGFRSVNEAFLESTGEVQKVTESLAISGGDIDVDRFLVETGGPGQRDVQEQLKAKAIALNITKNLIKGDAAADPEAFDGFQRRCLSGDNLVPNHATVAQGMFLTSLDEAIDNVEMPTHLLMNKTMKRRFAEAARDTAVGGYITYDPNELGMPIMRYAGLPIITVDKDETNTGIMLFNEADNAGGAVGSSIYVLSLTDDGVVGLQGGGGMDVRDMGEIDTAPVYRTRVEWYIGMAIYRARAITRLWGFTNASIQA